MPAHSPSTAASATEGHPLILLTHRAASGRLTNIWEYDPARRAVDVVIGAHDDDPIELTLRLCAPRMYRDCAHTGDHDNYCFAGYPVAPRGDDWLIGASRFHALLPRDSLLLTRCPPAICSELASL